MREKREQRHTVVDTEAVEEVREWAGSPRPLSVTQDLVSDIDSEHEIPNASAVLASSPRNVQSDCLRRQLLCQENNTQPGTQSENSMKTR